MTFAAVNLYGSKTNLEQYSTSDKAALVLDCLLVAAMVTAVCLVVIAKVDLGLGAVGTLSNPVMPLFIGLSVGIFVSLVITMIVKSQSAKVGDVDEFDVKRANAKKDKKTTQPPFVLTPNTYYRVPADQLTHYREMLYPTLQDRPFNDAELYCVEAANQKLSLVKAKPTAGVFYLIRVECFSQPDSLEIKFKQAFKATAIADEHNYETLPVEQLGNLAGKLGVAKWTSRPDSLPNLFGPKHPIVLRRNYPQKTFLTTPGTHRIFLHSFASTQTLRFNGTLITISTNPFAITRSDSYYETEVVVSAEADGKMTIQFSQSAKWHQYDSTSADDWSQRYHISLIDQQNDRQFQNALKEFLFNYCGVAKEELELDTFAL